MERLARRVGVSGLGGFQVAPGPIAGRQGCECVVVDLDVGHGEAQRLAVIW